MAGVWDWNDTAVLAGETIAAGAGFTAPLSASVLTGDAEFDPAGPVPAGAVDEADATWVG